MTLLIVSLTALLVSLIRTVLFFPTPTTNAANINGDDKNHNSVGIIDCGVYLAPSSIPFAGLGMYVGNRSIAANEAVTGDDIIIPIIERPWHIEPRLTDRKFLWSEYIWNGPNFDYADAELGEDLVNDIEFASPGVGSAANSYMSLINVVDDQIRISRAGLSNNSPGQGAFTIYHNRSFTATHSIVPGSEIFVSYGEAYFTSRKKTYGYLPMPGEDYERADFILQRALKLILYNKRIPSAGRSLINKKETSPKPEGLNNGKCYSDGDRAPDSNDNCGVSSLEEAIREEIWNDMHALIKDISNNIFTTSTILNAIPSNVSVIEEVLDNGGTAYQDYNRSIKDLDWLEENGQCMDNIKAGRSKIPHAGRGAFASRFIPSGGLVSPAPLVHVEDIDNMVMFIEHVYDKTGELVPNRRGAYTWQLIVNYCFAHRSSTLLLCPYGLLSSLINHSKDNFNTKVTWSEDHRMRHPEWFNMTLGEWTSEYHTGLQIDFVATRDIEPDEEILIDYGLLWQSSWDKHVKEFTFERYRSKHYMPAYELNELVFDYDFKLRTEKDREYELDGVQLYCRRWYLDERIFIEHALEVEGLHLYDQPCSIIRKMNNDSYVVRLSRLIDDNDNLSTSRESEKAVIFWGIPRDAFFFEDLPYTRDMHQEWTFRHPMMIPDEIFPDIWKNIDDNNDDDQIYPHFRVKKQDIDDDHDDNDRNDDDDDDNDDYDDNHDTIDHNFFKSKKELYDDDDNHDTIDHNFSKSKNELNDDDYNDDDDGYSDDGDDDYNSD